MTIPGDIEQLKDAIDRLIAVIWPLLHFNQLVATLLNDSLGLLLKFWFRFLWATTDFDSGGDFTRNATIVRFDLSS